MTFLVVMPTFNDITLSLPSLSRDQLEDIRKKTTALLKYKTSSRSVEEHDWLLAGVLTELRGRGLYVPPNFQIRNDKSFAAFQTKSQTVRDILVNAAPKLSSVERVYLGQIAGYELCQYLTWLDLSLNVVLERIHLVPSAIDKSFPGYIESGMLGVLVHKHF